MIGDHYIAPQEPGDRWQLPDITAVINDLELCGGSVNELLHEICGDDNVEKPKVLYLIEKELRRDGNEDYLQQWQNISLIFKRVAVTIGTEKFLHSFKDGVDKNSALIKEIGKNVSPEIWGKTDAGATHAMDAQKKADALIENLIDG